MDQTELPTDSTETPAALALPADGVRNVPASVSRPIPPQCLPIRLPQRDYQAKPVAPVGVQMALLANGLGADTVSLHGTKRRTKK